MKKLFLLGCFSISLCLGESPTLIVPDALLIETRPLLDDDEIKIVDKLIRVTQEQLRKQEQLRELMLFFQKHKEEFIQGNQSKAQASRLVRTARQIQEMIQENHLEHLFAKDYLDELQFFSSIAGKTSLSRP